MTRMSNVAKSIVDRRALLKAGLMLPAAVVALPKISEATGIPRGTVITLRLNASTNGYKLDNDGHGGEWVNVYGVEYGGTTITGPVQIQLSWSGSRKTPAHGIRLDSKGNGSSREYEHQTGVRIIGAKVWC